MADKNTKKQIENVGISVFLSEGYESASLRNIARLAGVTTGAIYGYYANKQALFESLVAEPVATLVHRFQATLELTGKAVSREQVTAVYDQSGKDLEWMVDYIYDHFDAFKLILCSGSGTGYENYIDGLVAIEMQATKNFIQTLIHAGYSPKPVDDELMHILANALFSGIFEVVRHDMDRERARSHVEHLVEFSMAGWNRLLGL